MPVFVKFCAVLMFIMLVRCPVIGQQVCARLAAMSVDCTKGNTLVKSLDRRKMLRDQGKTFLSLGVQYDRAVTPADPSALTIEKQYRIGMPLMAGYRLGRCSLEAGAFLGVNMCRPQQSFWFANPENSIVGLANRQINPTATVMLAVAYEFSPAGSLNLRYTHLNNEVLANSALGNLQLGWTWNL